MLIRVFLNFSSSALRKVNSLKLPMLTSIVNHPGGSRCRLAAAYGIILCLMLAVSAVAAPAQGGASAPRAVASSFKLSSPATAAKSSGAAKTSSKPSWQELKPAQQVSLKPLAANWSTMAEAEKRKWIVLAANYSTLTSAEQAKLHSRMTEWSSLSQQQRNQARLNFAGSKRLTPTQKAAKWEAYQALSPEEKKKLAISAPAKPRGGAVATKPVPPQQLAQIPMTEKASKPLPIAAGAAAAVDRNTLLPHSSVQIEPAPVQKN
jgi:hypothetical protein